MDTLCICSLNNIKQFKSFSPLTMYLGLSSYNHHLILLSVNFIYWLKLWVSFTICRDDILDGKIPIFLFSLTPALFPFHHLIYYLPWRNKMIKPSLKNQAFMQDCYNKQFYNV